MIMISSKAGKRLARARASELAALNHWAKYPSQENWEVWQKTQIERASAGSELADELIADRHHQAEGD
ncbi:MULTISPECIES: hypothetical protein [Halomonadaceae]|uniref:hypothetical protein n=1 Tax=Halomonadaceae TaxID=28256 RepID=UPI00159A4162|nr:MULTISPECIES: hypothetical protein [Halomonas]QJQ93933.1 hypothetical protein HIO72_00555 [Halomonas sp. PA5]